MAAAQHLAPLAVAVPIVVACVILAAGRYLPRAVNDALGVLASLGVLGVSAALVAAAGSGRAVVWVGGWRPQHGLSVGIVLVADRFGAGLALIAALLVTCALIYSLRYFDTVQGHFHALMLLFLAGMVGFALSGDLFDMFVFFELMGAVAYALTGYRIEDASSVQGAVNFGVINSLGAYLSLTGVAILYAHTGQLGLPQLSAALSGHRASALVVAGFVLVCTGFLVKAAMAPFHFWLDDAHAVAPTPVCILFSGVMVELGVYGAARTYWVAFSGTLPSDDVRRAFLILGVFTAVLGAVMCLGQRHFKRLLAYSTIAHVGLFLCAFAAVDPAGTAGLALYVAGHAGVKAALFLLGGALLNRYGSVDEGTLHGRGRHAKVMPWLFVVGALALAGLPPFGTALGKAVSEDALRVSGYPFALALFVLVSAATGGAVLRATGRIFFGLGDAPQRKTDATTGDEEEPETGQPLPRVRLTMLAPILLLLVAGLAVGIIPAVADALGVGAERFVDRSGYVSQALAGAPARPVRSPHEVGWTASGVGLGVLSALLACGVAALGWYGGRLRRHGRQQLARLSDGTVRATESGLGVLRRLHSGHVGDYAAWLLVGVAVLGALVGVPLIR